MLKINNLKIKFSNSIRKEINESFYITDNCLKNENKNVKRLNGNNKRRK